MLKAWIELFFEKARKLTDNNLTKWNMHFEVDVDVNINFALKMAEVESSLGIYSTFYGDLLFITFIAEILKIAWRNLWI